MNNRKSILLILPWLPYPLKSGGHQAIYNGIRAIKDCMNIYITYLDSDDTSSDDEIKQFCDALGTNISVFPYKPTPPSPPKQDIANRMFRKAERILKRWNIFPTSDTKLDTTYDGGNLDPDYKKRAPGYIRHVQQIIKTYHIDIVQCEMMRNITFVSSIPAHVYNIFVHHEIKYIRKELELCQRHDAGDVPSYINKLKETEVSWLNKYDKIVTLSSTDTQKLIHAGVTTPIVTSFATIDTIGAIHYTSHRHNVLSFLGAEKHPPNKIGLTWFLENCWINLRNIDPSYCLRVIGNWENDFIKQIYSTYKNVEFLGFIDDLDSVIQDTIMIVPITIGSGIRMKILEAAGRGVPFISTSVGAEGLPVENNVHCLIADTPQDFIDDIITLSDFNIRSKLATNANTLVLQNYSFESLKKNRIPIYPL